MVPVTIIRYGYGVNVMASVVVFSLLAWLGTHLNAKKGKVLYINCLLGLIPPPNVNYHSIVEYLGDE